jgi:hypothetical protein
VGGPRGRYKDVDEPFKSVSSERLVYTLPLPSLTSALGMYLQAQSKVDEVNNNNSKREKKKKEKQDFAAYPPQCATGKSSSSHATTQLSASSHTATLPATTATTPVPASRYCGNAGGKACRVKAARISTRSRMWAGRGDGLGFLYMGYLMPRQNGHDGVRRWKLVLMR